MPDNSVKCAPTVSTTLRQPLQAWVITAGYCSFILRRTTATKVTPSFYRMVCFMDHSKESHIRCIHIFCQSLETDLLRIGRNTPETGMDRWILAPILFSKRAEDL